MNRGASYLVASHNMVFNKTAIKATESNHVKVVDSMQKILNKHEAKEARKVLHMSPEMKAKKKQGVKPPEIIRTEDLL